MTLIIELLFGTSLLFPAAFASTLSFSPLFPGAVIAVIIFLSSIPEVIWLVKLHLFPLLPPLKCSSSISCLGGCNHSRLVLGPRPWRPTSTPIHRHGDDPHLSPWRQPLNSGEPHPPKGLGAACARALKHAWTHTPSGKLALQNHLGRCFIF